jgi:D-glycero-D-manno-heptose 1,7-bisphosphate phosphatase
LPTVPESKIKPAIFLDRDGVINRDVGYLHRPEDLNWTPGVFEGLRALMRLDCPLVIVTNQSGIGRGKYTETAFLRFNEFYLRALAEKSIAILDVFYAPDYEEAKLPVYRADLSFRKPAAGMLFASARRHSLDLNRSLLIGDKETDMQAAEAAGVTGVLFEGQNFASFIDQRLETFRKIVG